MVAKVLVEISNINIDKTFNYIIPDIFIDKIKVGIRVKVEFVNKIIEGFVIEIIDNNDTNYDLKEIISIVDEEPILNDELIKLGKFMSKKYFSTLISCYQTMLPKALKAKNNSTINKKIIKEVKLSPEYEKINIEKLNDTQKKIINTLIEKNSSQIEVLNKISSSSVKTLIKKGILVVEEKEKYRLNINYNKERKNIILSEDQERAKKEILSNIGDQVTFLLHGVTGSGKTIVYMEIIEEMLKLGKDSIFLVPEISLTPQIVDQFKNRFGDLVAVLHSRLSEGEKYDEYRKISTGKVHIVVGARSAVFAPFKNIGLIIIDEEHTSTYKQDNNPKYSAIEIAQKRAEKHNSIVILGSATPSLESYAKSLKKVYKLIELPKRINNNKLPSVDIINMNDEYRKGGIFSKKLIIEIENTLNKNEQVILLLNRRGYSSFVTCSNCGFAVKCPHCDITLTYHKTSNMLRCHYCGYATKNIEICPSCKEKSMKNLGVGTEKVEDELNKLFNSRILRMDLDTTTKKGSHEKMIKDFQEHKYDILLGTQMIAKGLNFSDVTLVGIINADTSLLIPNYRSSEYTFQLLMQTAGRSGRGEKEGKVIIQTFNPNHYAINLAQKHDYIDFFYKEMSIRRKLSYPPYYYLSYIKIISKDYNLASVESKKIGAYLLNNLNDCNVLGPSPCSIFKLNGLYRFGIVIKYKKSNNLYEILNKLVDVYKNNTKIKLDIDMNPNNF